MDKRFKNKTYEELYEIDWKRIKEDIYEADPFDFTKENEWLWGDLWIGDAIETINPILNPCIYTDKIIKEIEKIHSNLFVSEKQLFSTNIGDFEAKYCYIDKDTITFYNENKNKVASVHKSAISDLYNDEQYIIDK